MYVAFCRLYPPPPPSATTAVFGSYLPSLYSWLRLYCWCGLAYPFDWRGFVRSTMKTASVGLSEYYSLKLLKYLYCRSLPSSMLLVPTIYDVKSQLSINKINLFFYLDYKFFSSTYWIDIRTHTSSKASKIHSRLFHLFIEKRSL